MLALASLDMLVEAVVGHVSDAVLKPSETSAFGIFPVESLGRDFLPVTKLLCDIKPELVRVLD